MASSLPIVTTKTTSTFSTAYNTFVCFCLENPIYLATMTFTVTSIDCEDFLLSLAALTSTELENWCLARTASGTVTDDLIIGILDSSAFTATQAAEILDRLSPAQLATIHVSAVKIEKVPSAASSLSISLSVLICLLVAMSALLDRLI
ncbi:MAG: hypothetical protein K2Q09_00010 [Phycisphaerales bacterium]|nr:hypothetical protein [Phycisphaerales bacterium]